MVSRSESVQSRVDCGKGCFFSYSLSVILHRFLPLFCFCNRRPGLQLILRSASQRPNKSRDAHRRGDLTVEPADTGGSAELSSTPLSAGVLCDELFSVLHFCC